MQDVGEKAMFKWKSAEKLEQPKITEVIVEDELSATAVVEQAEPAPLPIALPLADVSTNSIAADCANSIEEAQLPVALPPKESAADLVTTAAAQKIESAEAPPELGDRYEVIEFIGSGGMGSVWKVYDKQLDGTFAVKVLKPELLADATAVKRFEKEANLASDLTHANIAAIFGPGTDSQGRPFIIMGYVDGDSLADILACEGKLSEERALDIFTQICEALSHSHMKGIIHRDIKPSNIIISKTESGGDMVHIVDFGIARCIYDEVTKTQALTKAVDIFGSPRYMSPEQFLGNNVTGQSDIYSLGCVFYEMLTGAPPFTDENPVKLILQHISETPDLSKVPIKFQMLLYSCLAKEPEQRVLNAEYLLVRIAALSSEPAIKMQPMNLFHCMFAVLLILIPGLSAGVPSSSFIMLYPSSLLMIWMYVVFINRDNAGRSINYKILELNLFLATCALVIIGALTSVSGPLGNMLIAPLLAGLSLWLIVQPRAITAYSNCMSYMLRKPAAIKPYHLPRFDKWAWNAFVMFMYVSTGMLSFSLVAFGISPMLNLVCGADTSPTFVSSELSFLAGELVFGSFFVVVFRLLFDTVLGKLTAMQSLRCSLKLQTALVMAMVLGTLAVTATVGRSGLNQFVRQNFGSLADRHKQQQVRLEALGYPDSPLSNQAKLLAASDLWLTFGRRSDALALCQQVIDSKIEKDPVTLATAYKLRFKFGGLSGRTAGDTADLEKALSLLAVAPSPFFAELESSVLRRYPRSRAQNEAFDIGELAVMRNDLGLGMRALNMAQKPSIDIDRYYFALRAKDLQAKLVKLSKDRAANSPDHR